MKPCRKKLKKERLKDNHTFYKTQKEVIRDGHLFLCLGDWRLVGLVVSGIMGLVSVEVGLVEGIVIDISISGERKGKNV